MKKITSYKNFFNGRFFNEGIRNTVGIVLPAVVLGYFGQLSLGLVLSLGALCVSVTDSPGPVHHRVNGMLICNMLIALVSVVVCYAVPYPIFLGVIIFFCGFLFSMLTVYGLRTSSIGIAALLIMILSLQSRYQGLEIWRNALYIFAGGSWYLLFSITLYSLRPYKIVQQILGDFVIGIGEYFRTRSHFYKHDPAYEKTYQLLLQQQVNVLSQQSLLSEILFKTRTILKETTHTGRVLLKIYVDAAELFESIMTAFQDYRVLHAQFDKTGILEAIQQQIVRLADELELIGLAIKSNDRSIATGRNLLAYRELKLKFEALRLSYMTDANVDEFVSLGRIFNNLQHLTDKINGLHYYTSYDKKIKKVASHEIDLTSYAAVQDIRPMIFFNNLNFKSNIFRHALRVAFALVIGYIISVIFSIGHSYWILLTIVVILKPAYSLTKKRNSDRLIGTFFGILAGVLILFLFKDKTILLVIMVFFMASSYAFIRTNYFISVLMMTPYLIIFFHMLHPQSIQAILLDRLLDTTIGSLIAFLTSLFLVPVWEHQNIRMNMIHLVEACRVYYLSLATVFSHDEQVSQQQARIYRRDVLTELANVSDAFTRMLSEPKRFQKGVETIHQFVVLSHILTSHFASLSYFLNTRQSKFRNPDLDEVIHETDLNFSNSIHYLAADSKAPVIINYAILENINNYVEQLLLRRREEVQHGELETETRAMLISSKSVIDQFNHIFTVSADLTRCASELNK